MTYFKVSGIFQVDINALLFKIILTALMLFLRRNIVGKWTDKDTSNETGDSSSKVAEAEHDARDDGEKAGIFERGNNEKNSERFSRDDSAGQAATSFWDSIFGSKK